MKKLFVVIAAVFVSTGAFAQHFEWGVKAGLNLATQTKVDDLKMRPGLYAGAFAEYVIGDYVGVQAELMYSMMGAKAKYDGATATDKTDYIVLPIYAKLYILEGLSVDIGPQFGYMVSAKLKGTDGDASATVSYYDDVDKKFDVSAVLGLSYKLNFGLDVSAHYNLGLTKLADGTDSKNGVIAIGVGYRF